MAVVPINPGNLTRSHFLFLSALQDHERFCLLNALCALVAEGVCPSKQELSELRGALGFQSGGVDISQLKPDLFSALLEQMRSEAHRRSIEYLAELKCQAVQAEDANLESLCAELEECGLIQNNKDRTKQAVTEQDLLHAYKLSTAAREELSAYQVQSAVIMAAGFSSRFAPLSYEKPKGRLRVKGQVLIERQIEQLLAAGVSKIVVVLGYLKEEFFYLDERYPGILLLINDRYQTHNNMSSLLEAREHLGRSYICSSDNYYGENLFEPAVFEPYYSTVYFQGPTDEMVVSTAEDGRISAVEVGGRDNFALLGHAFFDREFTDGLFAYVDPIYERPEHVQKLWEEFWLEQLDQLCLYARFYSEEQIKEFDSLDDLRKFDPLFILNSDSQALTNISSCLELRPDKLMGFLPIKTGTNRSFSFIAAGKRYVYRQPVSSVLLERAYAREAYMNERARDLGLDLSYLQMDPHQGWKLSYFIETNTEFNPLDATQRRALLEKLALLHTAEPSKSERASAVHSKHLELEFDFPRALIGICERLQSLGLLLFSDATLLKQRALAGFDELLTCIQSAPYSELRLCRRALCHNDLAPGNIFMLAKDESLEPCIIDWEQAGVSYPLFDYLLLALKHGMDKTEAYELLREAELLLSGHDIGKYQFEKPLHQAYMLLAYWCFVCARAKECVSSKTDPQLRSYYSRAREMLLEV